MVGFNEPIVVDYAADGRDIDKAVEHLPVLAAETTDPTCSGSDCEGNQENKRGEADGDEGTLGDVFEHAGEIEGLVGTDVGEEVQADVGEGEEAEHAAKANEVRKIEESAQRRDSESDEEEAEGPIACEVLEEFHGIGTELAVEGARGKEAKRRKTRGEGNGLGPIGGKDLAEGGAHVSSIFSGPCPHTCWRPGRNSH